MIKPRNITRNFADRERRAAPNYEIGNKILLDNIWVKDGRHVKLGNKWIGPFKIVKLVGKNNVELKLPSNYKNTHSTFHVRMVNLMKHLEDNLIDQNIVHNYLLEKVELKLLHFMKFYVVLLEIRMMTHQLCMK